MERPDTLDGMSTAQRKCTGLSMVALASLLAFLVAQHPEQARVPLWVIWYCCAAFASAGVTIAVYSATAPIAYRWSVVATLACMFLVPAWIALSPTSRHCTSNIPLLASELSCRLSFGVGALLLAFMLAIALLKALRSKNTA